MKHLLLSLLACVAFICCKKADTIVSKTDNINSVEILQNIEKEQHVPFDAVAKTIHIFVALCDNQYQGIVPVPEKIGNGHDPNTNLYWGCGYGIRSYFKKSKDWKLVNTIKQDTLVLERLVFKHATKNCYLVADAYNGKYIKQCTQHFLAAANGAFKDTLTLNGKTLGINGNSSLIGYIGHDGLMDFDIDEVYKNTDGKARNVIILACFSKRYFSKHLNTTKVNPLVWTTHLMCPEAYTIHDAITGYLAGEDNAAIRKRAVSAYAKYQKCSEKAAGAILVTGW
jgi:hypothetical protein